MTKLENANLVLGREEVYKASSRLWSFKFTDDIVNGINLNLSNMVSAYPFECGVNIRPSTGTTLISYSNSSCNPYVSIR